MPCVSMLSCSGSLGRSIEELCVCARMRFCMKRVISSKHLTETHVCEAECVMRVGMWMQKVEKDFICVRQQ